MVKHNDGYTLLEMIIVLSIVSILSTVMLIYPIDLNPFHESQILYQQSLAMRHQITKRINERISFNHNGNINHACTQDFNHKTLKFQLGFGRFYE
ncbi:prepilin-type N-terminal cleavage/methylation domain-containing protein [Erysipelothrix urinaevulpis]|uniref:prepilin-type N-terminal cleavage/methylation domain-containing protein n=1 Tax=Erysipelothrix urinaevulpis TaxID=2683717 RepID=UPI0038B34084